MTTTYIATTAILDETRTYRYRLDRQIADEGTRVVFILLNPSTADEDTDDPTIRRCTGFARRLGAGYLTVVNIFALRATNPKQLYNHADPVGPENDHYIAEAALDASCIIAAWGNHGVFRNRGADVISRFRQGNTPLQCFGRTKKNQPKHPLYLAATTFLSGYRG